MNKISALNSKSSIETLINISNNRTNLNKIKSKITFNKSELISKQIDTLEKGILILKKEKEKIKLREIQLIGAMNSMKMRNNLYIDFEQQLLELTKRIENRHFKLKLFAEKIQSFFNLDEYNKKIDIFNKNNLIQNQLIIEHKQLIQKSLDQERYLLLLKMKLRHCHDHRDLGELRSLLNRLKGGGKDDLEDKKIREKLKFMINNLKNQIKSEKNRIQILKNGINKENLSAIIIQKNWRKFIIQKKYKLLKSGFS